MSKIPDQLKQRIFAYNLENAKNQEMAEDLEKILGAMPPGIVKNLLKNEIIGPILDKYGITGK